MKKVLTISFVIVYSLLSVGMNVIVHTCGGESEAIIATSKVQDPCVCYDEMPMDSDEGIAPVEMCCTTELTTVQINDVQTVTHVNIKQNLDVVDFLPSIDISIFDTHNSSFAIPVDTSPPQYKDLQISNSVFLI